MDIKKIKEHIDNVLIETNFDFLGKKKIGKVRDIYEQKDKLILVSTDRHSSFDRIIAHIPFKGQILTQSSIFWFNETKDIIQNHMLESPDPNVIIAKKCEVLPIEVVPRAYITGSTNTSLWTLYQKGQRDFGNFTLPDGLRKNQKLEKIVLTLTTKSDEHDEPLTPNEALKRGLVTKELWEEIAKVSLELFKRFQLASERAGFILVDTKYEFGLDEKGKLILIDEIHTPDSARWYKAATYRELFDKGMEQQYFDKEFLRLWFKDNCDPYKDEILPKAPPELVAELSRRYIEIYETITGQPFEHDFSQPIIKRIRNNLNIK
ncbi:phosphoribosylaminoimidazolesuccinocarboxamide synthase [Candidatus Nomurabacteria bacterium RIFCSPHIGHO2_01_FULL_38_19]|uniref:Phosphoribosylaminoimidazole-succinocarboxamide synthase n=1 Tax=Candidatus Nomurabacteria bacterium RIFCSPHIGHO2_01_FULL_38_19 TaxID=1801732 RepID=A0A1F6UU39_9BACT|nr:MAG: phosphoribosylaminoimidazolesuccinocarboxamide synthase [Candidatus Nomurabacteria bacterium RIFCSPHIGHO2_01_FULL_38_19]